MDLKRITAIAFDKDGTLFDFDATWAGWAARALRVLAKGDEALARAMAEDLRFDLDRVAYQPDSPAIAGTIDDIVACLAPHLPAEPPGALAAHLVKMAEEAAVVEVTPLVPFARTLKSRGLALGVVTNDAEAAARAHLAAVGATDAFDFIAGSDSGHGGKPAPGQLLAFAEFARSEPETIIMVGDSTHDLLAAKAAGMIGIGVLTGPARKEDLAPFAHAVLPSIADLPVWLLKGQAG